MTFTRRPGFALSAGITLLGASLMILLPLAALALKAGHARAGTFAALLGDPRVRTACLFSLGAALAAALFNLLWGTLLAWVLVRYPFPGRRLADALVDLPFALPTAVAGLTLASLYGPKGWIGRLLPFSAVYNQVGVVLALSFVSLPFVVRSLQPVLEELPRDMEEAAACLGASRWATLRRVVLPQLMPALLSGFALSFARAVGEYGSVVFISGNLPFKTEIAPLLIVVKLEQYDYDGAVALAVVMLAVSLLVLLAVHQLHRRFGGGRHV
ncbi:MAG TPA: sulfate ABC transporter permease subunit CysT [Geothrix sp.]